MGDNHLPGLEARPQLSENFEMKHRWSLGIRLLHWLTAGIVAAQVALAFTLFGGPGMNTVRWLPIHMSLGVGLLAVVAIRLAWRAMTRAPHRPVTHAAKLMESIVHAGLYLLLAFGAVTGWLAYRPSPLMPRALLFGLLPTPTSPRFQFASPRDFAMAHEILVWALLLFIAIHVGAVLVHEFVMRDKVLPRMLFGKERGRRP